MTTAHGFTVGVVPGLLDDDARYLYMNGQCAALAVELARATGAESITAVLDDDDTLLHAYVVTGASAYDVRGRHDPADVEESYGITSDDASADCWDDTGGPRTEQFYLDAGESDADDPESVSWLLRHTHLQDQDFVLARSFVPSVLAESGILKHYHGSTVALQVGDYIEPGHSKTYDASADDAVYTTVSVAEAEQWARDGHEMRPDDSPVVYVYEVEPNGDAERGEHSDGFTEFRSPRARITGVRSIPSPWVQETGARGDTAQSV